MKKLNVAVVGATGLVGQVFIDLFIKRQFPVKTLRLLASEQSAGRKVSFKGQKITIETLTENSFHGFDFAFFSAGTAISEKFAPIAAEAGCTVIDNSNAFRMDDNVPLVVPEINFEAISVSHRIIANPNCSTIQMVAAINPLHQKARLKRVVVSTYQAVSGTGKDAVAELDMQSKTIFEKKEIKPEVYPHQIAFNLIPQIDTFLASGYTGEEMKMVNETRKILQEPDLPVTATCVRVPVRNAHSLSVNLEFHNALQTEEAVNILRATPGVVVMDEPGNNVYPTPAEISGKDEVYVGRIRKDPSVKYGLNVWIVADNLKKGAALNAVQIAEKLLKRNEQRAKQSSSDY